jgi:predicted alpha/beta hydrolase family esterase
MPRFLILHGLTGSGPEHWQSWLTWRLRRGGHEVRFPELPDADHPQPEAWDAALREEIPRLGPGPGSVVVCHSLGSVLWLRHATTARREDRVDRVLLVAPPCEDAMVPELEPFLPAPLDAAAVARAAGLTRLVCSDDDPACRAGAARIYGDALGIPVDLLPGRGHLNAESGLGPWPELEAWCLGGRDSLV